MSLDRSMTKGPVAQLGRALESSRCEKIISSMVFLLTSGMKASGRGFKKIERLKVPSGPHNHKKWKRNKQ